LHADRPTIRTPESPFEPLGIALGFPPDYSAIAAPLRAGDRRLGVLELVHHTPGRYGDESRAMTATFASYAAVAIENTRLYEAAQEQAWVSTVLLQVAEATQSLTTLDEVLETVTRLVPMLVGTERCGLLLTAEEERPENLGPVFVPAAAYGLSPSQRAAFDRWRVAPGDVPAFDHLCLVRTAVVIHDVRTDPRVPPMLASELGFESLLLMPLLSRGQVLGAMLADFRNDHPEFGEERLMMLRGIAHQTAAAVENARLLEARQAEAYVSAALLQAAQAVVRFNRLDDILTAIVRIMPILVGVERCAVFLWDAEASLFRLAQAYGLPGGAEGGATDPAARIAQAYAIGDFPLLDLVRERNETVLLDSPTEWRDLLPSELAAALVGEGENGQSERHSLIAVPLSVAGDLLGVMLVEDVASLPRFRQRRLEIITGIAQQAALAVQNDHLRREMAERERLERELQLAREIQQTFLPDRPPDVPGWELAVVWRAARQVAGDFYDFFELPEDRLGLVIADVADKGMPAALFMALTRALVRAAALEESSPAVALERVNELLVPDARRGMFVTAVYGVLSLKSGQLTCANAGHHPPLVWRARRQKLEPLGKGGMALGVLAGTSLGEQSTFIEPGDYLIFYTDGITEALSPAGDFYGEERLRATIRGAAGEGSAQTMLDAIEASVAAFVGDSAPSDDITIMVLRRAGE